MQVRKDVANTKVSGIPSDNISLEPNLGRLRSPPRVPEAGNNRS